MLRNKVILEGRPAPIAAVTGLCLDYVFIKINVNEPTCCRPRKAQTTGDKPNYSNVYKKQTKTTETYIPGD